MKKNKPYKYLKFYHECMVVGGYMPAEGLCYAINAYVDDSPELDDQVALFMPTKDECLEYDIRISIFGIEYTLWGGDPNEFNDFRQNVVLLLAAINGEL